MPLLVPEKRANGTPFTAIATSYVTVWGDTTARIDPVADTVSVPRATRQSSVTVALFASGPVMVSCETTWITGLSRSHVLSRVTLVWSVSRPVATNVPSKASDRMPAVTNPPAEALEPPSSGAAMTLAMIPGPRTRAAVRSASRRWGALAYTWLAERKAMGAVPSRAPGPVVTAAGDPAAESMAANPSNPVDCSTPEAV